MQMRVRGFLAVTLVLIGGSTASTVTADDTITWRTHTIHDREGYGRIMPAYTLRVPENWKVEGRIAWRKPCSARPLFETLYRITSPSGRVGMRMAPSFNIVWHELKPASIFPAYIVENLRARQAADRARLRQKFRGSNCRFGWVRDGQQLINQLVLAPRSRRARIVSVKEDVTRKKQITEMVGQFSLPNSRTTVGAVIIRLRYPTVAGEVEEDVALAWWTTFIEDVHPQHGGLISQNTVVQPILSAWAPVGRLDANNKVLLEIGKSVRANPEWERRVADSLEELRRRRAREFEERQDQRRRDFDRRTEQWKKRQKEREEQNQRFIRTVIREEPEETEEERRRRRERERERGYSVSETGSGQLAR